MFTRAIVRPPAPNFAEGLTTVELGAPDYTRALAQHAAYCAALESCGLTLTTLAADSKHPDATFVEDTAIVTERCALLTRPGAPTRAGEVAEMKIALAKFFPSLPAIEPPGTLDGGDVCEAGDDFFIGISERTNPEGAQQLANILTHCGFTATFIDIRGIEGILHLKSGLSYLGGHRLAIISSLAARPEFSACELIPVSSGEEYAANCILVNGRVFLPAGYPLWESRLADLGYQTIALEMSEFQKMDGGLSCLSIRF